MKEEDFTNALVHIMFICKTYMFYPGYVENLIFIIDTNHMSFFNFPFGTVKTIINTTSKYFPHTLEKVFIMNPSFSLYLVWKIFDCMKN